MRPPIALLAAIAVVFASLSACSSSVSLTDRAWQWTAWTTPPSETTVSDPPSYTIAFVTTGPTLSVPTFQGKADCNTVAGVYRVAPAGRLNGSTATMTILPTPATLADCGPGSQSETFVRELGRATSYRIAGAELIIDLSDGTSMTFRVP